MKPDVWIRTGSAEEAAFARTTHMGVVAHPDDLEIEGYPGIVECFGRDDRWFCGVVVTDGAGSARGGPYAKVTNEEMVAIRRKEQHKAAMGGEYGAMVMLGVTSAAIKDPRAAGRGGRRWPISSAARGRKSSTRTTSADKHDTHVSVALGHHRRLPRRCPADQRPRRLLGGEGWRDLDWLTGDDKVALDVSAARASPPRSSACSTRRSRAASATTSRWRACAVPTPPWTNRITSTPRPRSRSTWTSRRS